MNWYGGGGRLVIDDEANKLTDRSIDRRAGVEEDVYLYTYRLAKETATTTWGEEGRHQWLACHWESLFVKPERFSPSACMHEHTTSFPSGYHQAMSACLRMASVRTEGNEDDGDR